MHMANLLSKIVISILLILLGLIIGKFINFPHFVISKEIDLINILSIIVTIGLAVAITTFFDKRKSDYRTEKDLIIKRVDDIYNICSVLQIEAVSGEIEYTDVAYSIKRINVSINSVYGLINKTNFNVEKEIKSTFKTSISELRDILTNTPLISEKEVELSDIPISVKNGVIHFNRERISHIEMKFDKLKNLLLEWQIIINKK